MSNRNTKVNMIPSLPCPTVRALYHHSSWDFRHSAIAVDVKTGGSLHVQFRVPDLLKIGNAVIFYSCRHLLYEPSLHLDKKHLPGCFPLAKAITKAMAITLQSEGPSCI